MPYTRRVTVVARDVGLRVVCGMACGSKPLSRANSVSAVPQFAVPGAIGARGPVALFRFSWLRTF